MTDGRLADGQPQLSPATGRVPGRLALTSSITIAVLIAVFSLVMCVMAFIAHSRAERSERVQNSESR